MLETVFGGRRLVRAIVLLAVVFSVIIMACGGGADYERTLNGIGQPEGGASQLEGNAVRDKAEIALDYVSQAYGVPKDQIEILYQWIALFPLMGREIWGAKIYVWAAERVHLVDMLHVYIDESGNVLDRETMRSIEEKEKQAQEEERLGWGKISDEYSWEKFQGLGPDEEVVVDISIRYDKEGDAGVAAARHQAVTDLLDSRGCKIYANQILLLPDEGFIVAEATKPVIIELEEMEEVATIGLYGEYEDLEGNVRLSISEEFTGEDDGAHILLKLATERIYGKGNCMLCCHVRKEGSTVTVEIENVLIPQMGEAVMWPARFSTDLGKGEGESRLIVKYKDKEDAYDLIITTESIEVNPATLSFTSFQQPKIKRTL